MKLGLALIGASLLSSALFIDNATTTTVEKRGEPREIYLAAPDATTKLPIPLLYVGDSGGWSNVSAASDGEYGSSLAAHKGSAEVEYLEYDLGGVYDVEEVRFDHDGEGQWFVDQWKLEAFTPSSGWQEVFPLRTPQYSGWNGAVFPPVRTSRLRFFFQHRNHVEVREVEAFGRGVAPTCFDGVQNQREEGVDCGGPCGERCLSVAGLSERPLNNSCLAGPAPASSSAVVLSRIWDGVNLQQILGLVQMPGDSSRDFVAVTKNGLLKAIPAQDNAVEADARVMLDYRSRVATDGEGGMLGLAFHPNFDANGIAYFTYTTLTEVNGVSQFTFRLSSIKSLDGGLRFDPSTEQVLVEVPQDSVIHQSGGIDFGTDGKLYVSLGDDEDGEAAADPFNLKGSILRLDVDESGGASIPGDNPFGNEVWALGFRNPWRFSFDEMTGDLWAIDVGDCRWEEVNKVERGGFYGWPFFEADRCIYNCTAAYLSPEYKQSNECSDPAAFVGGFVYRGSQIPSLYGKFVHADFETGVTWSYDPVTKENVELFDNSKGVTAWAEGNDGELYYTDIVAAGVFRLERNFEVAENEGPPEDLIDTGCFASLTEGIDYVEGVVPYTVAQPFWSDGADKERALALPNGAAIGVKENGDWELPPGAVTIKHFKHEGKYFETRFFVRHDDGSYGAYTYEWLNESSAKLVSADGKIRTIGSRPWDYPSRGQCFDCHTAGAGFSLGLETRQFNVDRYYEETGRWANQVTTLRALGMLEEGSDLPPHPAVHDISIPIEERARSYLHVNCGSCHFGEGSGRASWDARYETPLWDKGICGVAPLEGVTGWEGEELVAPGDFHLSTTWRRMTQREERAMPPIGSLFSDRAGSLLLQRWISSLAECPQKPEGVEVPSTIEAEQYARASDTTPEVNFGGACERGVGGVDMEITGDVFGGNCAVGWTDPGEWLEFDIYTPETAKYNLIVRTASEDPDVSLSIELDGVAVASGVRGSGAGWQTYYDRFVPNILMTAGAHTLRVRFDTGWQNLNYIVVEKK